MEYISAKYLVYKGYFRVKSHERKNDNMDDNSDFLEQAKNVDFNGILALKYSLECFKFKMQNSSVKWNL